MYNKKGQYNHLITIIYKFRLLALVTHIFIASTTLPVAFSMCLVADFAVTLPFDIFDINEKTLT